MVAAAGLPGLEDQAGLYRGDLTSRGESVQDKLLEVLDIAGGDVDEVVLGTERPAGSLSPLCALHRPQWTF